MFMHLLVFRGDVYAKSDLSYKQSFKIANPLIFICIGYILIDFYIRQLFCFKFIKIKRKFVQYKWKNKNRYHYILTACLPDNRWTRKVGFSEKDKIVDENLIFLTVGGPQFPFLCKCQIIILKTPSSFIIKDKQEEKKVIFSEMFLILKENFGSFE